MGVAVTTPRPADAAPADVEPAPVAPAADGRHARRERNRTAVVDALLELYREGRIDPSTDEIAARAGVSARSLFRYFDDVDDLCRVAIGRQHAHVAPLTVAEIDPALALPQRIEAFVRHRIELYRAMSWVGIVARARGPYQPLIAAELDRLRAFQRGHATQLFGTEVTSGTGAGNVTEGHDLIAAVDALCSFESFCLLGGGVDGDPTQTERILIAAVSRLLHPGGHTT